MLYELFLVYSAIELTLKAVYMLQRLICGPLSQVWGKWLDILILTASNIKDLDLTMEGGATSLRISSQASFRPRGGECKMNHREYFHLVEGRDLGFNTVLGLLSRLSFGAGSTSRHKSSSLTM